jgi:hypothetical protein
MSLQTGDPALATDRIEAWLADALGLRAPVTFARVGFGQSALTYRVTDAGYVAS